MVAYAYLQCPYLGFNTNIGAHKIHNKIGNFLSQLFVDKDVPQDCHAMYDCQFRVVKPEKYIGKEPVVRIGAMGRLPPGFVPKGHWHLHIFNVDDAKLAEITGALQASVLKTQ